MEIDFEFKMTEDSRQLCENIVDEMTQLFNITTEEAIEKINELWGEQDFADSSDERFHEDAAYWAKTIYYGPDFIWWDNEPDELEMQIIL